MFEELDDPQAPQATTHHREAVQERVASIRRRRHWINGSVTTVSIAIVAVVLGLTFAGGSAPKPTRSAEAPTIPSPVGRAPTQFGINNGAPGSPSHDDAGRSIKPPTPPPCPAHLSQPSFTTGGFCGPAPHAGDGLGPGGECMGQETTPPCGPGTQIGTYYNYTLPQKCNGLIIFDGRRWYATMTPPTDEPDIDVWMRLESANAARWIGPMGTVGYVLDVGQAPPGCSR